MHALHMRFALPTLPSLVLEGFALPPAEAITVLRDNDELTCVGELSLFC
jgi:hypothetical protein